MQSFKEDKYFDGKHHKTHTFSVASDVSTQASTEYVSKYTKSN